MQHLLSLERNRAIDAHVKAPCVINVIDENTSLITDIFIPDGTDLIVLSDRNDNLFYNDSNINLNECFYIQSALGVESVVRFSSTTAKIWYSFDNDEVWYRLDSNGVFIPSDRRCWFRGYNPKGMNGGKFNITGSVIIGGKLGALLTDTYYKLDAIPANAFSRLFEFCTALTDASDLTFEDVELGNNAYSQMFYQCTNLAKVPLELPATVLGRYCYWHMFDGCTSLVKPPALPATKLADYCYSNMFYDCTSLEALILLPATDLTDRCYEYMFYNCRYINDITCLANNPNPSSCYNWVYGVKESGNFYKNRNVNWEEVGASGIPQDWDVWDVKLN